MEVLLKTTLLDSYLNKLQHIWFSFRWRYRDIPFCLHLLVFGSKWQWTSEDFKSERELMSGHTLFQLYCTRCCHCHFI